MDPTTPIAPMAGGKQKSGKGLKITTAVMAVVALCGIGFGVFGVMQSQKAVKVQIKNNDGTVTTVDASEIEKKENTVVINNIETTPDDLSRYIYIAQWGIKIKIPEPLSGFSYHFDLRNGYETLEISGASCEKSCQYVPAFVDMTSGNSLAGLARYYKDDNGHKYGTKVVSFGDYDIYYEHPHVVVSETEDEMNWELESASLLEKILKNKDNYSQM